MRGGRPDGVARYESGGRRATLHFADGVPTGRAEYRYPDGAPWIAGEVRGFVSHWAESWEEAPRSVMIPPDALIWDGTRTTWAPGGSILCRVVFDHGERASEEPTGCDTRSRQRRPRGTAGWALRGISEGLNGFLAVAD